MHLVGSGSGPSATLTGMTAAVNDVAFTCDGAQVGGQAWLRRAGVGNAMDTQDARMRVDGRVQPCLMGCMQTSCLLPCR